MHDIEVQMSIMHQGVLPACIAVRGPRSEATEVLLCHHTLLA